MVNLDLPLLQAPSPSQTLEHLLLPSEGLAFASTHCSLPVPDPNHQYRFTHHTPTPCTSSFAVFMLVRLTKLSWEQGSTTEVKGPTVARRGPASTWSPGTQSHRMAQLFGLRCVQFTLHYLDVYAFATGYHLLDSSLLSCLPTISWSPASWGSSWVSLLVGSTWDQHLSIPFCSLINVLPAFCQLTRQGLEAP